MRAARMSDRPLGGDGLGDGRAAPAAGPDPGPPSGTRPAVSVPSSTRSGRACWPARSRPASAAGSKPAPSSSTVNPRPVRPDPAGSPGCRLAPACLAAFCTASRQQKYAAASTSGGYRPDVGVGRPRPGPGGADGRPERGARALVLQQRGVDPARQSDQRGHGLGRAAASWAASSASARSGARPASVSARRRFTARATRCCWAPSWMSRSSRRRAASWASTSRCRDARSSSSAGGQLLQPQLELGAEPDPAQDRARPGSPAPRRAAPRPT